jgi:hypothetical protein
MRLFVSALVCVLLCFGAAHAQSDRGTITGTVSDPAGAMIPNAAIEAKNLQTGAVYQTVSSATGNYTLAQLPVGTYQLTASVTGFKQYVRTGITVMVAQILRIDIPMEVGSISETVTVSADAPLLKTESGELAHNIPTQRLDDLPVMSIAGGIRSAYTAVNLIPGGMQISVPGGIFGGLRVNGMPAGTLALRIEGQDATQTTWSAAYAMSQPSVDAIEETAIQTSNFAAEFGQVGGGMFNMTMKSGTNELHGTAFEYLRNETMFNAAQPYNHYRPRDRRHDWGFSVGGPVYLPKLYDGRDKTFFHFSFEQNKLKTSVSSMTTIPTTAYRNGDFSNPALYTGKVLGTDILGRPIMDGAIYDPLTTRQVVVDGKTYWVRDPFPGNIIPSGYSLDPVAVKLQSYLPQPTNSSTVNNYLNNYTNSTWNSIYSIKMDHNLSPRMKLSGYWSMNDTYVPFPDGFNPPITTERDLWETAHTVRLNFDYTISPTVLLHLGAGFLHFTFWDPVPEYGEWDNAEKLGLPGTVAGVFPTIYNIYQAQGGGLIDPTRQGNSMGPVAQQKQWQQKPTGTASLSWVRGNHTYKFGGEFRVESYPSIATTPSNGWFFFSPAQTALPYLNQTSIGGGNIGFPYASFLLGQVNRGEIGQQSIFHVGKHSFAFFAQDSWKVTRKLTIDYGLRYDYQTYLKGDGRIPSFGYDKPNPRFANLPGAQIFEGRDVENFADNYPYSFGPRLGIAYQLTPRTVLRGGIGISYGQTAQLEMWSLRFGSDVRFGPATTYGTPISLLKDGPPGGVPQWPNYDAGFQPQSPGAPFMTSIDRHAGYPPRQLMWSVGLQREITKDMSIEASYVGNRGVWWNASGTLTDPNRVTPAILAKHNLAVGNVDDAALLISQFETVPADVKAAHNLTEPYPGFKGTVSQSLRPHPHFGSIFVLWAPLGNTWYDSLQVKFTKRYSRGLDMQASYVWSKETTVGTESQDQAFQVVPAIYNLNDLRSNKSLSLSSVPHRFVLTATYLTPTWSSAPHAVVREVLKDWRFGAYLVYQSGLPITAPIALNQYNVAQTLSLCAPFSVLGGCNTSAFYSAPATYSSRVPGQPLYTQDINDTYNPQKTFILNPNAWQTPPPATFGTGSAAYNDYRYRRAPMESLSLERIFRIREQMSFNIRVEMSNVFNRTRIPLPYNSMLLPQVRDANGNAISGFGYASNWQNAGGQRTGQLVMRFNF